MRDQSTLSTQPAAFIESVGAPVGAPEAPQPDASQHEAALTPAELAELVGAFNGVALRLQQTQETLRAEVRRLESELSDSKKELKRARELAALGEMAAGIAHEIRNPLGSMKLYARLLIDDLSDRPAEQTTARKIAGAVDRVNEIVTDVLALARDLKIEPREHDARALIEAALGTCLECLHSARVGVTMDGSIDSARAIRCDAPLMQQVIANIVRNACEAIAEWDHRPEGSGTITIACETRSVLLADARRQSMAVLRITDDGPGISAEAIDRAFNPFYTTRETGTGLGLAIVHRVLDAHGGWARITRNEPPATTGTTVELLLPDHPPRNRGSAEPRCNAPNQTPENDGEPQ